MNKKVLFLHDKFPAGGAERITMDIANYIASKGFCSMVCARETTETLTPNIELIQLPDHTYCSAKKNIDFVVDTINHNQIDVFILPVQAIPEICENVRTRTKAKIVFALHSIPFWELTYRLYEKKNKARGKLLKTLAWYLFTYPKMKWGKKYKSRYYRQYNSIYQQVDAFTVLCDAYKDILQKGLQLGEQNKIYTIQNSERSIEGYNNKKKKQILYVGRFSYEDKRVDRLIKIWESMYRMAYDWELILVGDGPERCRLENYIKRHHLERIKMVGFHNDVTSFYHDASVLCMTSTFEGWPLCLTEAQAHGVVPIAFDCTAGVHDILAPSGKNGILISPFNKKRYAQELLHLLNDDALLKEMSQNCRKKSLDYSPQITGKKWHDLLNDLTNNSLQ